MASINTMVASMKLDFTTLNKTMVNYTNITNNVINVNNQLEKSLNDVQSSASKAGSKIKDLFGKLKSLKSITKVLDLSDSLTMSNTKLNVVNDGKQSNEALHAKVAAAAGSSRSTYKDISGYVSRLSNSSGDTFKNNDQAVAFTELMQKSIVAGGTDDRGAAMNQMIDSVSKGSLGSDDLKAASGTSPLVMKSLESYTGKSEKDLYEMADKGKITANDIKNAMFSMSDEINKQFGSTKTTFGETWDRLKEGAMQASSGVLEKLNEIVSNPQVQQFVDKLIAAMYILGDAVSRVCDFFIDNWSVIGPILGFIGGVALVSIMQSLWGMIPVLWSMLQPILIQAAEWLFINTPILLIVGALTAVIVMLINMGVSFEEVCIAIGGFLGLVGATAYNVFVSMWNGAAAFINFLGNSFHNGITNIKILFLDLAINALKNVADIAGGFSSLITKLTGKKIDIAAGITGITDTLSSEKAKAMGDLGDKVYVKNKEYTDTDKAVSDGKEKGGQAAAFIDGKLDALNKLLTKNEVKDPTKDPAFQPFAGSEGAFGDSNTPVKVEGTGAGGSVNVDMPDEDKEYLKNIAERDYIANVATNSLAPNISVQFGEVHQTADANKIAGRIKKILQEQIAMASEGVY